MDDESTVSPRNMLRAYEQVDACRLAAIILELVQQRPSRAIRLPELHRAWASRYPGHVAFTTGTTSIKSRISINLAVLRGAGILSRYNGINVADHEKLAMAAGNLRIVQGDNGVAVPPLAWARRPIAPPEFVTLQAELEIERAAK